MPTVLTLSPAFGGAAFGPFPAGVVSIGSAAGCSIVVPSALPQHVWVTERGGRWTVQPASVGAPVFALTRGGPVVVRTAHDLASGESFALGSPAGVAYVVTGVTAGAGPRRGPPSLGALGEEVQRRAGVEAMRLGPIQEVQRAWFRVSNGTVFRPEYVVAALFALVGGGALSCTAVVGWVLAHVR